MPHITLEYTRNLQNFAPTTVLAALNGALFASGLFSEPDIKSRAIGLDDFLVGTQPARRAFIHVRIAMLAGRSAEERKKLADAVLAALLSVAATDPKTQGGLETQISVETTELDRPSYAKAVLNG